MSEHTLETLKKLSMPALQHAELVEIARTETPNKAYELAIAKNWPPRQAKATRFLAILRRDFGGEAFEAFLNLVSSHQSEDMEHAQPDNGIEHVQSDDTGLVQKGNAMETALDSLYPDGVRNVVFATHASCAHTMENLIIVFLSNEGENIREVFFRKEVESLNLSREQVKTLAHRILDAMLAQWATPEIKYFSAYGNIWVSAMFVARTYFADDKDYYKRILTATIVYQGGYAKDPVSLFRAVIPQEKIAKMKRDNKDKNRLSGLMPQKALQPVVDHSLEYFTAEELGNVWGQMLITRFRECYLTSFIVEWWKDLKVGEKYLGDYEATTGEVNRLCLMRDIKDLLSQSCDTLSDHHDLDITWEEALEMLEMLALFCWRWGHTKEGQGYFEGLLIDCLARGQAAKASIVLARLGRHFNLCSSEATLCDRVKFENSLHRLIRDAIKVAVGKRSFGVAVALAEYLGDQDKADELRPQARLFSQKAALDFTFYTRASR